MMLPGMFSGRHQARGWSDIYHADDIGQEDWHETHTVGMSEGYFYTLTELYYPTVGIEDTAVLTCISASGGVRWRKAFWWEDGSSNLGNYGYGAERCLMIPVAGGGMRVIMSDANGPNLSSYRFTPEGDGIFEWSLPLNNYHSSMTSLPDGSIVVGVRWSGLESLFRVGVDGNVIWSYALPTDVGGGAYFFDRIEAGGWHVHAKFQRVGGFERSYQVYLDGQSGDIHWIKDIPLNSTLRDVSLSGMAAFFPYSGDDLTLLASDGTATRYIRTDSVTEKWDNNVVLLPDGDLIHYETVKFQPTDTPALRVARLTSSFSTVWAYTITRPHFDDGVYSANDYRPVRGSSGVMVYGSGAINNGAYASSWALLIPYEGLTPGVYGDITVAETTGPTFTSATPWSVYIGMVGVYPSNLTGLVPSTVDPVTFHLAPSTHPSTFQPLG